MKDFYLKLCPRRQTWIGSCLQALPVSAYLTTCLILEIFAPVMAAAAPSELGWQPWEPLTTSSTVGLVTSVTNAEFGSEAEFEQACTLDAAREEAVSYWFRRSELFEQIGIGQVEFGCGTQASFLRTRSTTAIRVAPVTCLRVDTDRGSGLNIRSGAGVEYSRIGAIANGKTLQPAEADSIFALTTDEGGRQWLSIQSPQSGYVSVSAAFGEHVNLSRC